MSAAWFATPTVASVADRGPSVASRGRDPDCGECGCVAAPFREPHATRHGRGVSSHAQIEVIDPPRSAPPMALFGEALDGELRPLTRQASLARPSDCERMRSETWRRC